MSLPTSDVYEDCPTRLALDIGFKGGKVAVYAADEETVSFYLEGAVVGRMAIDGHLSFSCAEEHGGGYVILWTRFCRAGTLADRPTQNVDSKARILIRYWLEAHCEDGPLYRYFLKQGLESRRKHALRLKEEADSLRVLAEEKDKETAIAAEGFRTYMEKHNLNALGEAAHTESARKKAPPPRVNH